MLLGNKGNVSESLGLLVVLSIFFPLNQLQTLRGITAWRARRVLWLSPSPVADQTQVNV